MRSGLSAAPSAGLIAVTRFTSSTTHTLDARTRTIRIWAAGTAVGGGQTGSVENREYLAGNTGLGSWRLLSVLGGEELQIQGGGSPSVKLAGSTICQGKSGTSVNVSNGGFSIGTSSGGNGDFTSFEVGRTGTGFVVIEEWG